MAKNKNQVGGTLVMHFTFWAYESKLYFSFDYSVDSTLHFANKYRSDALWFVFCMLVHHETCKETNA